MELSNRETAAALWLSLLFLYTLKEEKVRRAILSLLSCFFQKWIVIILSSATLWVSLSVLALHTLSLWATDNLKTTLIWGVAFALTSIMDINRVDKESTYFKQTIKDTINVTALVTFIAEMHSYSLIAELIIFPILATVSMMQAMSSRKEEHKKVHKLCNFILLIAGAAFIYHSIAVALEDPDKFATVSNLREFSTPIILTLTFLPFIYLFSVLVAYDRIFAGFNWRFEKDADLRRYAKIEAALRFGFNLPLLRRWVRDLNLKRPTTREDIHHSIRTVKARRRLEKSPPLISRKEGWSPYTAKDFLAELGIPTSDYYPSFEQEWNASSKLIELSDDVTPNNIAYYIKGNNRAAKELKVKLNVNSPKNCRKAEATFRLACFTLLQNSQTFLEIDDQDSLEALNPITVVADGKNISLAIEQYEGGIKGGYSRIFVIEHT
ncbi:hypothetical protein ACFW0H_06140 [Pseudomonas sp. CR3202]|uniref:hypothetical protein n=1 Tax=Pseudomonas sp. CR3202 TaxID=3351532 RepID=UPI003BEF8BF5